MTALFVFFGLDRLEMTRLNGLIKHLRKHLHLFRISLHTDRPIREHSLACSLKRIEFSSKSSSDGRTLRHCLHLLALFQGALQVFEAISFDKLFLQETEFHSIWIFFLNMDKLLLSMRFRRGVGSWDWTEWTSTILSWLIMLTHLCYAQITQLHLKWVYICCRLMIHLVLHCWVHLGHLRLSKLLFYFFAYHWSHFTTFLHQANWVHQLISQWIDQRFLSIFSTDLTFLFFLS